jgi:hypothetical protein
MRGPEPKPKHFETSLFLIYALGGFYREAIAFFSRAGRSVKMSAFVCVGLRLI